MSIPVSKFHYTKAYPIQYCSTVLNTVIESSIQFYKSLLFTQQFQSIFINLEQVYSKLQLFMPF